MNLKMSVLTPGSAAVVAALALGTTAWAAQWLLLVLEAVLLMATYGLLPLSMVCLTVAAAGLQGLARAKAHGRRRVAHVKKMTAPGEPSASGFGARRKREVIPSSVAVRSIPAPSMALRWSSF